MTGAISDHLPEFSTIPNMFGNIPGNKFNIDERDWSKFDRENFILKYFSVEWEDLLKIDEVRERSFLMPDTRDEGKYPWYENCSSWYPGV